MEPVEEISEPTAEQFEAEIRPAYRPVVIRGIAKDWALVREGRQGPAPALDYLRRFDSKRPTQVMLAQPQEGGRFFYSPDIRGLNFQRQDATLTQLADQLQAIIDDPSPPAMYAGATPMASHLPGLSRRNDFALVGHLPDATPRLWLGNATQVATHFDMSDNFAVVALGSRRFTVFPPDATADLYVGPLNFTLAGQPVSMVDPLNPDHDRYPRYAKAQAKAQYVDLQPGDAIYIPTLWWHHVNATAPVNILMNYWHNNVRDGGAFLALAHAMLSVRDLPQPQREAWRHWFEHFVFGPDAAHAADHLPKGAEGINGPASEQRTQMMRQYIASVLAVK